MDGNNRWSKKNNIGKYESYNRGAKKLIEITNFIFDNYDVKYISAFALSKHNMKRGSTLINIIQKVLIDFLDKNNDKGKNKFNIKFKGDLTFLPTKIINGIKNLESSNKISNKNLIIFLNYSGKQDIHNAAKSFKKSIKNNGKVFSDFLLSGNIPEPDILIRSGGYKRLSDYLLYQVSFTELFFTKTLWPDIKKSNIKLILKQYLKIERKFGN